MWKKHDTTIKSRLGIMILVCTYARFIAIICNFEYVKFNNGNGWNTLYTQIHK